eukprot:TRINITY_DN48464_c0_g1_i1.p1 TRINITY_DN48464_c0_g1~~TRINITY_DN48464_c0_g1_i1.p1  ORF type:complete len:372 (-),score=81.96 TRINITY_DN48464_c0_g1_i1:83-1111(-)
MALSLRRLQMLRSCCCFSETAKRHLSLRLRTSSRRQFSDYIDALKQGSSAASPLRISFASACLPHPAKVAKGGEDAFFADPATRSFGVADGVGGWAETGVDPGRFARRILEIALEEIKSAKSKSGVDLQGILQTASTRIREEKLEGGTTALLGQLVDSSIAILNLGDSGAILLRPALRTPPGSDQPLLFPRVVFRSSDQTHYFNCPYQLGSGNAPVETPDFIQVRVRTGDLIVAATDGVFDNLFDHQVQAIVARHMGKAWSLGAPVAPHLQGLATSIAKQAQRIGQQEDHKDIITPFALSAHSEGLSFRGGKLDDTTVVVGLIHPEDDDAEAGKELLNNFSS